MKTVILILAVLFSILYGFGKLTCWAINVCAEEEEKEYNIWL